MKKESFVTLRPFMITDLELKGAELIIFAIIYGLNVQDHSFNGSVQYLMDWTRGSRSHTLASLKSLMDKGYIVKEERWDEYKKYCTYNVADYILSENKNVMSENQTGSSENQTDGCLKIRPNNIEANNIDDKKDNKRKNTKKESFVPPTLEEVETYVKEKGLSVSPSGFYNYFTEGNWIDSKGNKVKSWKQKLLTWENMRKPAEKKQIGEVL
jgi:hypothetical protein